MRLPLMFRAAADALSPRHCAVCGRRLSPYERCVCAECTLKLPYTGFGAREDNPVERHLIGRFPLGRATSYLFYSGGENMRNLLFALKYHHRPEVGREMGRRMATALIDGGFFGGIDIIVPVPLARRREAHRGYNQSLAIAKGVGEVVGTRVWPMLLRRTIDNPTQTRLSPEARAENVKGIFRAPRPGAVAGRHILVIDDMITTGATVTACADTLAAAGASRISVLTLAASPSIALW